MSKSFKALLNMSGKPSDNPSFLVILAYDIYIIYGMYRFLSGMIFLAVLNSCGALSDKGTKEQVMAIAENYVKGQLTSAERQTSDEGVVVISGGDKKYFIDSSAIFTGYIDEDSREDALVTVISYEGTRLGVIEHLIIIRTDEGLTMQRSVESDMKILDLVDRIITAEIPTHPRSSPLYDCPDCREVVRYRYKMGELVKAE